MQTNPNTNIEHIIAKIDNDFNIDHSDWIPRVAAWAIEALNMLKCTKYETKCQKVLVNDKIVTVTGIDLNRVEVCDKNGCKIESMQDVLKYNRCSCPFIPSTGEETGADVVGRDEQIAIPIDPTQYPEEYVTTSRLKSVRQQNRYYIVISPTQLELNFNAEYIYIKYKGVKTEMSTLYNCELPVIPNNSLVIEAIAYYCMYKILCRGHKHPVMNLNASQYGTNPYYMWMQLKDQAHRSAIIDAQGEVIDDGGIWRSSFFNFTFNPRD